MKLVPIVILLIFPTVVWAHGNFSHITTPPGKLPGQWQYGFERAGEWFTLNLFTVSTRAKQEKSLNYASERLAEFNMLLATPNPGEKDLHTALARYKFFMGKAEDMAEKVIFLDGGEILLAEEVEEETRIHEQELVEILREVDPKYHGIVREFLAESRIQNRKVFMFMVEKYQQTDADIRKHQLILGRHMNMLLEIALYNRDKFDPILLEADKFRKAGLNLEAYDLIDKAKDIVY